MSTIRNQFDNSYRYHAVEVGRLTQIEEVLRQLGLADQDYYLTMGTSQWTPEKTLGPYVELIPKHVPGLSERFELTDTTPTLSDAARILLPVVGKFEKSFDEHSNEIKLTATFQGVRVILRDATPKTCTVEKVEVEEEVPATEAYTRKVTKYRLVGDCLPLMAGDGLPSAEDLDAVEAERVVQGATSDA